MPPGASANPVSGELLIKRRWVYETGENSRIARRSDAGWRIGMRSRRCGRATTERGMNAPLIVVDGKSFQLPLQVQTIPD